MQIRNFDPAQGQAFQGDIAIVPIPADIVISTADEIKPSAGRLIIQEGEATGHHHAIELPRQQHFRAASAVAGDPNLVVRDTRLRKAFASARSQHQPAKTGVSALMSSDSDALCGGQVGTARLYRDPDAVEELRQSGVLTRTDLAVGCLVVEDGPVVLSHDEHDGIRLPVGKYYVGRQVESAGAEERVVQD